MMLALGMFVFSLNTLAYQELQRQTNWRHASSNRVNAQPALQYTGRGDETITLPGILMPELAGQVVCLDELRAMGNSGKAWPLVDGTGKLYGVFVIENLSETQTLFFQDGTARRIEFNLALKRVDDGRADLVGARDRSNSDILRTLIR